MGILSQTYRDDTKKIASDVLVDCRIASAVIYLRSYADFWLGPRAWRERLRQAGDRGSAINRKVNKSQLRVRVGRNYNARFNTHHGQRNAELIAGPQIPACARGIYHAF